MTKLPMVGEIVTDTDFTMSTTIFQAIAVKMDNPDYLVIWGKNSQTGQFVQVYRIQDEVVANTAYHANEEEALVDYLNRAFGVSL